jgi:hypothetical protein
MAKTKDLATIAHLAGRKPILRMAMRLGVSIKGKAIKKLKFVGDHLYADLEAPEVIQDQKCPIGVKEAFS